MDHWLGNTALPCIDTSVAASPNIFCGANCSHFKRATAFGFGHLVSKHKTKTYARILGGHDPARPLGYSYD